VVLKALNFTPRGEPWTAGINRYVYGPMGLSGVYGIVYAQSETQARRKWSELLREHFKYSMDSARSIAYWTTSIPRVEPITEAFGWMVDDRD
jgi:hypothetical protein